MRSKRGQYFCGVTCPAHVELTDIGCIIAAHEYRARVESQTNQVKGSGKGSNLGRAEKPRLLNPLSQSLFSYPYFKSYNYAYTIQRICMNGVKKHPKTTGMTSFRK